MLSLINNLQLLGPFIEDCYSELGVREYSKLVNLSPPTSSKILKEFEKQNILKMRTDRKYLFFRANQESNLLRDLSIIYWKNKFKEIISYLNENLFSDAIILFGSLSKLETKRDSDIDLVVVSKLKKDLNLKKFKDKYKRNIQLFLFGSLDEANKELKKNIMKGIFLMGELK
jgi:predicted nucleotidyltransferase